MLKAIEPTPAQFKYYCPRGKTLLLYLWEGDYLFGLCSDRWVYCPDCKKKFIISQTNGFREAELDSVIIQ